MQKIILLTAFLALASAASLTPSVNLVVTYPNGHLQFQYGDLVTYTSSVAPTVTGDPNPTGSVTIQVDGATRGTCNLAASAPSANIVCAVNESSSAAPLTVGPHDFVTAYSGDSNYNAGSSTVQVLRVFATATLSITASPSTPQTNQAVTITVTSTVNPSGTTPAPTGNITFSYNGNTLGNCTVTNGGCTFTIPANVVPSGSYTVVGQYAGDSTYAPASGSVSITFAPATTSSTTAASSTTATTAAATTATTATATTATTGTAATTDASTTAAATTDASTTTTGTDATTNTASSNTGANTNANNVAGTAFTGTTSGAASICGSALITILAVAIAL